MLFLKEHSSVFKPSFSEFDWFAALEPATRPGSSALSLRYCCASIPPAGGGPTPGGTTSWLAGWLVPASLLFSSQHLQAGHGTPPGNLSLRNPHHTPGRPHPPASSTS